MMPNSNNNYGKIDKKNFSVKLGGSIFYCS